MFETRDENRDLDIDEAVRQRYSDGAKASQPALCCGVPYDPKLLEAIPDEVVERDYGCGDPTKHLRPGETVLDLGSGTGKACFLASQVVGAEGRVIGVDVNDDMLEVARRNAPIVAGRVGYSNVDFRKGRIQDLQLDRGLLEGWLRENPVGDAAGLSALEARVEELKRTRPLVADDSVDVIVSNCVLNLVRPEAKRQMFREMHRVLKRGGRVVISDIVCDEDVPAELQADPVLWSGCISGAFREDELLHAFEDAGFYGITVLERQAEPWQVVEGIEFRSLTVAAWKGKEGECWDQAHAVVYRGPFKRVEDDDGHSFQRGVRTAVCEKTFHILGREPYRTHVDLVEPRELVPIEEAPPFASSRQPIVRHPRETKGADYRATTTGCGPSGPEETGCC